MLYIGIDPGLSGAVAALDQAGAIQFVEDTPIVETAVRRLRKIKAEDGSVVLKGKAGVKRRYETGLMAKVFDLDGAIALAVLEQVGTRPGEGRASAFEFGYGLGLWEGILVGKRVPYRKVTPAAWKPKLGVPADKQAARLMAIARWPQWADLLGRKKDEARAEALFLALWARNEATGG